jgi:hypothetical protein
MSMRAASLLCSALLVAISLAKGLNAQTTTSGGLMGVITDSSNSVIPDASVEIKDNAKGTTQLTATDREGTYRFFFLAPGKYMLSVTREGFREESRMVNVLLGPPVTVNVTLTIAKANTTVEVTDDAPLIQAENGDVSTTISQKQISEVPNPGNDLTYIAQTAPGAIMQTDFQAGANFSILGMSGMSYLYTIDGMNDNENGANFSQAGALFLLLGQNQIQEATVVSTGYSGEFGGAAGGNINYITKSGGNQFHGNAQYYWNGRALNANDFVLNAFQKPRPVDIANQWAASVGGPIKKDKLFLFLDTEGLRVLNCSNQYCADTEPSVPSRDPREHREQVRRGLRFRPLLSENFWSLQFGVRLKLGDPGHSDRPARLRTVYRPQWIGHHGAVCRLLLGRSRAAQLRCPCLRPHRLEPGQERPSILSTAIRPGPQRVVYRRHQSSI